MAIRTKKDWGMWGVEGAFGIIEQASGCAVYEDLMGHWVDLGQLDLLLEMRA